jgi:hypothetical protein
MRGGPPLRCCEQLCQSQPPLERFIPRQCADQPHRSESCEGRPPENSRCAILPQGSTGRDWQPAGGPGRPASSSVDCGAELDARGARDRSGRVSVRWRIPKAHAAPEAQTDRAFVGVGHLDLLASPGCALLLRCHWHQTRKRLSLRIQQDQRASVIHARVACGFQHNTESRFLLHHWNWAHLPCRRNLAEAQARRIREVGRRVGIAAKRAAGQLAVKEAQCALLQDVKRRSPVDAFGAPCGAFEPATQARGARCTGSKYQGCSRGGESADVAGHGLVSP